MSVHGSDGRRAWGGSEVLLSRLWLRIPHSRNPRHDLKGRRVQEGCQRLRASQNEQMRRSRVRVFACLPALIEHINLHFKSACCPLRRPWHCQLVLLGQKVDTPPEVRGITSAVAVKGRPKVAFKDPHQPAATPRQPPAPSPPSRRLARSMRLCALCGSQRRSRRKRETRPRGHRCLLVALTESLTALRARGISSPSLP